MEKSTRGWVIFGAFIGTFILLQFYLQGRPHPLEGQPAPAFSANTLTGETVTSEQHLGQDVVLLDFWAIWCPPCRVSLPEVAAIAEDYADQSVAVYAVNLGDAPEHIEGFLEDMGIAPPVLLDPASAAAHRFGVSSIPHLVIIDRNGIVDTVHVGAGGSLGETLRMRIDALLEGDPPNEDN